MTAICYIKFFYLIYNKNWRGNEKITRKDANDVRSWEGNEARARNNGRAAGNVQKISRSGKNRTPVEQVKSVHLE